MDRNVHAHFYRQPISIDCLRYCSFSFFREDYAETDMGMIPVESSAPAIFANRYAERNLSVEERYERSKEMKTFKGTLEEYKKREYRKLDDSFKEKFLTNEDLQNTIKAYKLDVSKFWYLLLFVYDFIEDIGTNAPTLNKSVLEEARNTVAPAHKARTMSP